MTLAIGAFISRLRESSGVYPAVNGGAASAYPHEVVRVLALAGLVDLGNLRLSAFAGFACGRVGAGIVNAAGVVDDVAHLRRPRFGFRSGDADFLPDVDDVRVCDAIVIGELLISRAVLGRNAGECVAALYGVNRFGRLGGGGRSASRARRLACEQFVDLLLDGCVIIACCRQASLAVVAVAPLSVDDLFREFIYGFFGAGGSAAGASGAACRRVVILRSAEGVSIAVVQLAVDPLDLVAGIAFDGHDGRSAYALNDTRVADLSVAFEEYLIAGLRVAEEKLSFVLVELHGVFAACAGGFFRLAEQLQRLLVAECRQEAPVHEHITPREAVFLSVIPIRVFLVEIAGVLGVVRASCVCGGVVELGVARLFFVADFRSRGIEQFLYRCFHGVCLLSCGCRFCVFVEVCLPVAGSLCLHGCALICRALILRQDGIGSREDAGGGFQKGEEGLVSFLQFLHQKAELHLKVSDARSCIFCVNLQVLLARPVCPLRQPVARAVLDEVRIFPAVHGGGVRFVGVAELLLVAVLQVVRAESALRVKVTHQTGSAAV